MVLPSFHDCHVHPIAGGIELGECDLSAELTAEGITATLREYIHTHPGSGWIRGWGWQLPVFSDANPHRTLLDAVAPDRPVYLTTADGHSAWVNSRALALAGIGPDTPDPALGTIEREALTGEPSGTLRESAMDLVERVLPEYSPQECEDGLRRALALANRFGITALYDADTDEPRLATYAALGARENLSARVFVALRAEAATASELIPRVMGLRARYTAPRLHPIGVKLHVDGVVESHTAALLEPYADRSADRGPSYLEAPALEALVTALDRSGFQVHAHAMGDRAVRESLDALTKAKAANGSGRIRGILAHLELIHPEDIPRFSSLGVVAAVQPLWAYADRYITELTESRLGPERSRRLYPIGSLVRSGAVVAAGSDWNVSSLNPLDGIEVAITRRGLGQGDGPAWIPEERVDLATMLAAYTIQSAYAMQQEKESGSIAVGKAADLSVLDRNLFEIPAEQIHEAKVLLTLLEGAPVYREVGFAPGLEAAPPNPLRAPSPRRARPRQPRSG
jgi:predicted amidohydrolase YtcJ